MFHVLVVVAIVVAAAISIVVAASIKNADVFVMHKKVFASLFSSLLCVFAVCLEIPFYAAFFLPFQNAHTPKMDWCVCFFVEIKYTHRHIYTHLRTYARVLGIAIVPFSLSQNFVGRFIYTFDL